MKRCITLLFYITVVIAVSPIVLVAFLVTIGCGTGRDLALLWRDWR